MPYWEMNKTTKTKEENDKREINVAQEHFFPNHVGTFVHFSLQLREIAFWWAKGKTPGLHQFSPTFSILNKLSKYHFLSPFSISPSITPTKPSQKDFFKISYS